MYLLSGTLFLIAAFFIFIDNRLFSHPSDSVLLFFATISLFGGFLFYYLHFSNIEERGMLNKIKNKKFSILGWLILISYTFFIWPYPEKFPTLTHSYVRLLLLLMFSFLSYLDDRKLKKS